MNRLPGSFVLATVLLVAPATIAQDEDAFDPDAFRIQFQDEAIWHRDSYQPGTISPQEAFDIVAEVRSPSWVLAPTLHCPQGNGIEQIEWRDFVGASCRGDAVPGGLWHPCHKVSKKFSDYVHVVKDDEEVEVVLEFENDLCKSFFVEENLTVSEAKRIFNALAELSNLTDDELDSLIEANIDHQLDEAGDEQLEFEFAMMAASADFYESLSLLEELVEKWKAEAVGADTIPAPAPAVGLKYTSTKTTAAGLDNESTTTIESRVEWDDEYGYILREDQEIVRPMTMLLASKDYNGVFTGAIDASGLEIPEYHQPGQVFEDGEWKEGTIAVLPATPLNWYPAEECPTCEVWEFYPLVIGVPVSSTWEEHVARPNGASLRLRSEEQCVAVGRSQVVIQNEGFDAVDLKCGKVVDGPNSRNWIITKSMSTEYGFVLRESESYYDNVSSLREDVTQVTEVKTP